MKINCTVYFADNSAIVFYNGNWQIFGDANCIADVVASGPDKSSSAVMVSAENACGNVVEDTW